MEIETKIIKFGNSQGITIPSKIAKSLNLKIGDKILIIINDDKSITIKKS